MLEDDRRARVQRTFYDTFDGRLHEAGLALLHADGRLALVSADSYGERAAAPFEESPARLFAADLPDGRLRELVTPIVEMRALTPIARTRSQLLTLRVLNDDSKTVVRLVVESSTAQGPARSHKQLRTRVHVVPVRGYEKAAERMRQKLESDVGLTPAPAPLHDEAVDGRRRRAGRRARAARHPAATRPARGRRRRPGAGQAGAGDRGQPARHARRHRQRVPARPARGRAPHALAPARAARASSRRAARALPRPSFAGSRTSPGPAATSTSTCSTSTSFRAALPERRAARPRAAARRCSPTAPARASGAAWRARCARRAPRDAARRSGRRSWTAWASRRTTERPDAAAPIARWPPTGSARSTGGWSGRGRRSTTTARRRRCTTCASGQGAALPARVLRQPLSRPRSCKPMVKTLKALQDTLGRFQDREVQAERCCARSARRSASRDAAPPR